MGRCISDAVSEIRDKRELTLALFSFFGEITIKKFSKILEYTHSIQYVCLRINELLRGVNMCRQYFYRNKNLSDKRNAGFSWR